MTRTTDAQAASILARLKNLQRQRYPNIPPNLMLLLYAQQGLLARLDASEYAGHFVLKGALNLFARYGQVARATEDIDLAAQGLPNTLEQALSVFQHLCRVPFTDGLQFDPGSVTARPINETLRYSGVALTLRATLGSSQVSLPLDLSFGNVITPAASRLAFPVLLLDQAVRVAVYPLETIVTEKFAAFTELGEATTRMKDFYDLQLILPRETFEADLMRRALRGSFEARGTPVGQVAQVLSEEFDEDGLLAGRWGPYLRRTGLSAPPFDEVLSLLRRFYGPLLLQIGNPGIWVAGRWEASSSGQAAEQPQGTEP